MILLVGTIASCAIATSMVVLAQELPRGAPPIIETPQKEDPRLQLPKNRPYGTVFHMTKSMMCNDTPVVDDYIFKYFGQVPQEFGMLLKDAMGNYGMLTSVYINPINKSFSIVERAARGLSCIVSTGEMWTTQYEDPKF